MPGQPCCSGFFFARNIINQSSRTTCLIQRRRSIWNDTRKVVPEGGFEPPTRGFSIRYNLPHIRYFLSPWRNCVAFILVLKAYRERLVRRLNGARPKFEELTI